MENKDKKIGSVCRALIEQSTNEDYDFTCVAVSVNNGQIHRSYENDEYFNQVLVPTAENTRVERLISGLPLFDSHPYELKALNTLGISVGYQFTERGLELNCKFGARADEELRADIKNGILKTVSIEGDIYSYEITREAGKLPVYRAVDWEPTSLSFAPVPQDIESQIEIKRSIKEQIAKTENKSFINQLINKF